MREISRRDVLKSGIAIGWGAALSSSGARLLASQEAPPAPAPAPAPARPRGLPDRYLEAGIAALANVQADRWSDGHFGASLIAAWFFARELELDERTLRAIQAELDAFQADNRRHFEFATPREEADPDRTGEIAGSIAEGIDGLRGAGHGVIFSTLALKAFRHAPALAKPAWIDGVLRLDRQIREHFRPDPDSDYNRGHPLPAFQTPRELTESALTCFARRPRLAEAIGPVGMIHVVTFADALAELWEMGHESLAMRGSAALKLRINVDPSPAARVEPEPARRPDSPFTAGFWEDRAVREQNWGFSGHHFKFPYSYWRRRSALRDAELLHACDEQALRLLVR